MLNRSLAFGLLAAGLMIAPGVAFADSQRQNNVQINTQSGTAIGNGVNAQSSETLNIQNQVKLRQRRAYKRLGYCPGKYSTQSQISTQASTQNGGAIDYSDNAQASSSVSEQNQVVVSTTGCYR
ncbi:hypothetical protein Riv7116_6826 [Rivularia sp. PCC 7116]|uniref:hypothetical protein n=1 Tax=Rivularia sp. PCC 7116 TaxID=373994 RepID=UPI00029F03D1|nr:hypothetical protein [Rivularia sp. PCC 7116]AFY59142.1 hypothetical protein Riv7116_6826 [Rivularia sp. PCC 7116]